MLFSDTVVPYWPYYSAILWYRRLYRIGHIIQRYCGTEDGTVLAILFSDTVVQKTVLAIFVGEKTVLVILFSDTDGTEDSTVLAILFNNTVVQKTVPYWPYCSAILIQKTVPY